MKKVYTKPELFCEEYELSVSIAGNCGAGFGAYNVNTSDYKSCSYKMGPDKIFVTDGVCDTIPGYEGENGTACYNTVVANNLVFSS